jgi:Zn-dependent alcohol dehydrogenase
VFAVSMRGSIRQASPRISRMSTTPIETDYLVIGAGAIGMAFVDTLLTDTDVQIVMVDRRR